MRKIIIFFLCMSCLFTGNLLSETVKALGGSAFEITAEGICYEENELGNLFCDIVREKTGSNAALIPAGTFNSGLPQGIIYEENLNGAVAENGELTVYVLTGCKIKELMETSFSKSGTPFFLQQSGMRIFHDGSELLTAEILKNPLNPAAGFEQLDPEKEYRVAVAYEKMSGDAEYEKILAGLHGIRCENTLLEMACTYFIGHSPVRSYLDGRISDVSGITPEYHEKPIANRDTLKMAIITDTHVISKSMNLSGTAFEEYLANDRKLLFYSEEISQKVVDELSESDCDLVLVCGDLTKDGERESHEKIASILQKLEHHGKRVYVIDGNHDINNPRSFRFIDDKTYPAQTVDPEAFTEIYREFGYGEATDRDEFSLSYVAEPVSWLRIIAMDSCIYGYNFLDNYPETGGQFGVKTLEWIENAIAEGNEKGQIVIGLMHHGIVQHFQLQSLVFPEYVVKGWNILSGRFADLGMHMVFTGHFHAQDITKGISSNGNAIYDVQTGSLVTYPVPYRTVEIGKNGDVDIKSFRVTEIDGYDKDIPFTEYAENFLRDSVRTMIPGALKGVLVKRGISEIVVNALMKQVVDQKIIGDFTVLDMVCSCVANFYAGDETPDELTRAMVSKMEKSINIVQQQIANVAMTVAEDYNTPDNDLTLNLFEK